MRPTPKKAFPTPPSPAEPHPNSPVSSKIDGLSARLRRRGLRLTPSRKAMLVTLSHCPGPVTLAQLQALMGPKPVALATVFRSMLRLEEIEMVTRTIDLHGTANWELNLGRRREFRLTVRDTDDVVPVDHDIARPLAVLIDKIEKQLRQRGYTHVQLDVAFRAARRSGHNQQADSSQRDVA